MVFFFLLLSTSRHLAFLLLQIFQISIFWSKKLVWQHGRQGSPCTEQSLLLFPSWVRKRKGGSAWIMSNLWGRRSPNFSTSQSCSASSNWFFRVWASIYWTKPLVITEPNVASRQLLGLGSKVHVYPSNMLQMLLDSCRVFLKCAKIEQVKERLCEQGCH